MTDNKQEPEARVSDSQVLVNGAIFNILQDCTEAGVKSLTSFDHRRSIVFDARMGLAIKTNAKPHLGELDVAIFIISNLITYIAESEAD